jgi:hypothetical protein
MSRRAAGVGSLTFGAVLVALMCASRPARAQFTTTGTEERDKKADSELQKRSVRSGLLVELSLGYGVAGASGYPNNSNQIGDPNFYSSSDAMLGSGAGLFLGGAIADYLNFGFFFEGQSFKSKQWQGNASGFGLKLETFPLVYAVPTLKNLGAYAQFGIGSAKLDVIAPGYPEASGVQSFLGVGVTYEFKIFRLFGGHAVAGPTIEYDAVYSQAISTSAFLIGGRLAYYSGI